MAEIVVFCQDCDLKEYDHNFDIAKNGDIVCVCGSTNVIMSHLRHRCSECQTAPVRVAFKLCVPCRDFLKKEKERLITSGLLSLPSCGNVAASPLK
ncbi:hypothetical protein HN858_01600 [Candidatus Falkowbacteria bacterium]|jgi:hypothetical protein|nr:hypothetical protein [Candidatus Falkowbacteria bacterium]MBT5503774.1 hypothetical protein [Candidatus Falkowbacteria bacterium]MBT6573937.1 hypothetical protein [Candidatus Falkowbacteria bacterium]MBT7348348.1 hypothetical protein [Candidatus Falkowbacteria bacterium]MBT7500268.1 hypothetical protein [Candidatus Falkowbacteria bacterium]